MENAIGGNGSKTEVKPANEKVTDGDAVVGWPVKMKRRREEEGRDAQRDGRSKGSKTEVKPANEE